MELKRAGAEQARGKRRMHVKRRVIGAILLGAAWGRRRRYNTGRRRSRTTRRPATTPMAMRWPWTNKGLVYVDRQDRPVLRPFIYDNGPDFFQDGLARHVENGKMGFHDEALKVVIPARYDFAFPFRDGRAKVGMDCVQYPVGEHSSVQCKSWEYIDRSGWRVPPPR